MRVLYHHRTLGDGAEGVHIAAMVDAFRSLGHEVRMIGMAADGTAKRRSAVTRVRAVLPRALFEIAALAANVPDYIAAAREIRRFRPHLLYKRHARFDCGALLAARRAGTPTVLEVNCLFSQEPYVRFEPIAFRRLAASVERRALRLATSVAAVSSPLARVAKTLAGVDAAVVPNGADVGRFNPALTDAARVRRQYGCQEGFVVGWVGVVRAWHGLELLLEAVAQLPAAHLLVVGDGPGQRAFEEQARAAGLAARVTVTGRVPHLEMADFIAAMDVAVVADERTGVASPMKLLEYMAMGRPVVAPAMDNIRDVVTDRVNGLLFRPGDGADLLARLRELAGSPSLRAALGSRARETVEAGRTWPQIAGRIVALAGFDERAVERAPMVAK